MGRHNNGELEPLVIKDCDFQGEVTAHNEDRQFLSYEKFKTDTPVLPDVKLIEIWGHYDGPLSGICEVHGQKFYFEHILFDTWRFYDKQVRSEDNSRAYHVYDRLWSIFSVYDINLTKYKKKLKNAETYQARQDILDISDSIGIFWNYEITGKQAKTWYK